MQLFLRFIFITFFGIFIQSALFAKTPTIVVWNYYLAPPFVTSDNKGLSYDFVNLLNKKANNKFIFELRSIPRVRLNKYLNDGKQGIVLFVNWSWMGKDAKEKYLWTNKILDDQNEIISLRDKKIVFEGPSSLKGLTFGAIRGRKYKELESSFATNEINRYDVNKEEQILNMMIRNRIDVTSQPRTLVMAKRRECM